jgi:uncharacterized protein YbbC (DUF1343 family)
MMQAAVVMGGDLREANLQPIDEIVNREIQLGNIPGAVVLIGQQDSVVYRRAFGYRALVPERVPMTEDTIFDLASLTKPIATATAVMQLVERGKINLDAPVARYWPTFGANGKNAIHVRDLLKHSSGLSAGLKVASIRSGYGEALKQIVAQKLIARPGKVFLYSDIDFIVLGELVARVSGLPLDRYCARWIFDRLAMKDTGFKPGVAERPRIAPTTYLNGKLLQGEVNDPVAYEMGGISGHAGLFSTVDDLAVFAQMLLNGGSLHGAEILKGTSIETMTARQQTKNGSGWWGLGWEIAPSFNSGPDELIPPNSFGHTGYTGTAMWVDPVSKSYLIILTNRVHPHGAGDVKPLRMGLLRFVSTVLGEVSTSQSTKLPLQLGNVIMPAASEKRDPVRSPVRSGVDELKAMDFAPLAGLRVGLITNHTGIDSGGRRTLDLLFNASNVKLAALFSPEHGLNGDLDRRISSSNEPLTKLPVYSLYGDVVRPSRAMLQGLDALVFDIQDAGARFYTYITTMAYAMEEAAKQSLQFFVLDRPNPINAMMVQGPVMDASLKSFTGYFPLPVRYGMTVGELATMFNAEIKIGANLHIIKMANYTRESWYDQTGLSWVGPSPNLRTLKSAILYPGVAMVEGANLSVGRGTESPFELVGAPWIDGNELAAFLNQRNIRGVLFVPTRFTPASSRYQSQLCRGVQIVLVDRDRLDSAELGIEIVSALYRLYGNKFQMKSTLGLVGARWVLQAIQDGWDPRAIAHRWEASLPGFRAMRVKYLLYPGFVAH